MGKTAKRVTALAAQTVFSVLASPSTNRNDNNNDHHLLSTYFWKAMCQVLYMHINLNPYNNVTNEVL